jgi:peptidoglycan/xylan/chitin deacetylase (PgdA/CDA1 family)
MTILAIHDIRKEYFDLNLDPYQLTFDDGLYSQFYYFPLFKKHPQKLTYFITPSFVKSGKLRPMFSGRHLLYLKSKKYMYRTFVEGRFDHFMTVEELQEISRQPNVQIGAHSHFHEVVLTRTHPHKRKPLSPWKIEHLKAAKEISFEEFSIRSKLAFQGHRVDGQKLIPRSEADWEDFVKHDTELCLKWFEQNLKIQPKLYAFPFNEYSDKFIRILKSFGFEQFFGARPKNTEAIHPRTDIDSLING